jgi:hypothetical protein
VFRGYLGTDSIPGFSATPLRIAFYGLVGLYAGVLSIRADGYTPDAGLFPTIVGSLLLGLIGLQAVAPFVLDTFDLEASGLTTGLRAEEESAGTEPDPRADTGTGAGGEVNADRPADADGELAADEHARSGLGLFVWLAGLFGLVWLVGLLPAFGLFVAAFVHRREGIRRAVIAAAGMFVFVAGLLVGLDAPSYGGAVWTLLEAL